MLELMTLFQPQPFRNFAERWNIQAALGPREHSNFLDAARHGKVDPISDVAVADRVEILFQPRDPGIVQAQFIIIIITIIIIIIIIIIIFFLPQVQMIPGDPQNRAQ